MDKLDIINTSIDNYKSLVTTYLSSLNAKCAKRVISIENAMYIFLRNVYGYLPTVGEIKWPVLKPNYNIPKTRLLPFNEAWSCQRTDCIVHFFINDALFTRIFRNPSKYIPFLCKCEGVIGPDMSQYTDMPPAMRYLHAFCNMLMSYMIQIEGGNLYPNITWSKKDSYWYSYPPNLCNSVIAINSNGVHQDRLSLYRWKQGYQMALHELSPIQIIRYGQFVNGENAQISSYHTNERLNFLRNGSKRK